MQINCTMYSEYHASNTAEYRVTDVLVSLEQKLQAFKKHVSEEDYPDHMNVLGTYLLVKYKAIYKELTKRGVNMPYPVHQYMTPLYALPIFYRDLTVHAGELSKVPWIFESLEEITYMVDRCVTPVAIYSSDQLCNP